MSSNYVCAEYWEEPANDEWHEMNSMVGQKGPCKKHENNVNVAGMHKPFALVNYIILSLSYGDQKAIEEF